MGEVPLYSPLERYPDNQTPVRTVAGRARLGRARNARMVHSLRALYSISNGLRKFGDSGLSTCPFVGAGGDIERARERDTRLRVRGNVSTACLHTPANPHATFVQSSFFPTDDQAPKTPSSAPVGLTNRFHIKSNPSETGRDHSVEYEGFVGAGLRGVT